MKNRNLVIVILAIICAGLLAGVVYTVTKGKSGTQKKQEASAEAGADETESQSGIIEEDGKKYKLNPDIKTVLFMGVDKEEKADLGNNPGENGQSDSLNLLVLTVADVKEVTAPEGAKFPLKITFAMKGVTASSKVQILHYDAKKAAWEKIDTTVADGTVTGTFSSLSPVAFVVDKTTLTSATGTATSPATSATTVSAVAVLGLAAVAAAFGLKKKAVR